MESLRRRRRGRRAGAVVVSTGIIALVFITVSEEKGSRAVLRAESPSRAAVYAACAEILPAQNAALEVYLGFRFPATDAAPLFDVGHEHSAPKSLIARWLEDI